MATLTEKSTNIILTPEDIEAAWALVQLSQDNRDQSRKKEDAVIDDDEKQHTTKTKINKNSKKITRKHRIKLEVDDSDETLMIIKEWNRTESNPVEKIFHGNADVVERFSEPIKKQLTMTDVKEDQAKLTLGKHQVQTKMLHLLEDDEIPQQGTNGLDVSVYGPNGVVQKMKLKMWTKDTPVLTSGWNDFVKSHELKEHCDFLTIWMFRRKGTREICFAIDKTRHPTITRPLGRRILNSVFPKN